MKIAVIGASGWLGGTFTREALGRGHEVTAIGRDSDKLAAIDGTTAVVADINDPDGLVQALAGQDVVVSAVTDRTTGDRSIIARTAEVLLDVAPRAGVPRLAFFGGGGSLEVEPGVRGIDRPGFPQQYLAEARAQADALQVLRERGEGVDWTYISPPPHDLVPGEKTGAYRVAADDRPVVDEHGESRITSGDLASALMDEVEHPQFSGRRFTAAY